jgi:hypothetical protein
MLCILYFLPNPRSSTGNIFKHSVQGKANTGLKKQKNITDFIFNSAHAPAEAA